MRLLAFFAAIAVLFALSDPSAAQSYYAGVTSTPQSPPQSARAAGLRLLSWPGKVAEAPRARRQSAQSFATPASAPQYTPAPQSAALQPRRIWNASPAAPQPAAPLAQAALPSSIYAAPAPSSAPPPVRLAAAAPARAPTVPASTADGDYQPPHFYSLYREYGQTPDPIPLGPQFFASSTPDLAQPPPPVPHTVTTSGGRVVQQASPSPDDNPG